MANGVAVDLSHICTDCQVSGFVGDFKDPDVSKKALYRALDGIDVCVIPAGVPRKPGMTRDDLFAINASIVATLVEGIAEVCPSAMICIISNPVNSTVPIAAEVLKKKGVYDERRVFGISTLDIVRAKKFIGLCKNIKPDDIDISCIGGHSGVTILPLLSKVTPEMSFSDYEANTLIYRIQNAGTEVVEAKAGGGSATLSMAYSGWRFVTSLLRGMSGEENIVECAYVASTLTQASYFASNVELGRKGIEKYLRLPVLSKSEHDILNMKVLPELMANISKGVEFVKAL